MFRLILFQCAVEFEDCLETAPGVRTDFKIKLAEYHCTLDDFLEHDMGQRFFHQFLQNEYSSENLEFWLAVEAYREKYEQQKENEDSDEPSKTPENVYGYAETIAKRFIDPNGDKAVLPFLKDQIMVVIPSTYSRAKNVFFDTPKRVLVV